jgi:hypothetical protein
VPRVLIRPFQILRDVNDPVSFALPGLFARRLRTSAVRQKAMEFEVLNRDGYSNISGRSCPPNSMILSAGMFKRLAASRIASALGASYRQ